MNGGWLRHYSWRCQPVDTSNTEAGLRVSIFVECDLSLQNFVRCRTFKEKFKMHFAFK